MQYKILDKTPCVTLTTENVCEYGGDALVISADGKLTFDFSRKEHIDLLNGTMPIITNPSPQQIIERYCTQHNSSVELREKLPEGTAHLTSVNGMPFEHLIYAIDEEIERKRERDCTTKKYVSSPELVERCTYDALKLVHDINLSRIGFTLLGTYRGLPLQESMTSIIETYERFKNDFNKETSIREIDFIVSMDQFPEAIRELERNIFQS